MDMAEEMRAVEAEVGGRMGAAISGAEARAGKLRGMLDALKSGHRAIVSRVAGLGVVALVAGGLVLVAACASPLAIWSAYHAGKGRQDALDREAAARAVAVQAGKDKAAVAASSKRMAATDEADRAEIRRLKAIAAKASHRPSAPTCPGTVLDAIHGLSASRPAADE